MKKNIIFSGALCMLLLAFVSCSNEEEVQNPTDEISRITMTAPDFGYLTTRTDFDINKNGAAFKWGENDTVGIFPNEGSQVYFPMTSGAGASSASFTGGGWALKSSASYAAYYPFVGDMYLDKTKIPVSYEGQTQTGNGSTAHLGAYDFMASAATTAENGGVNFIFKHLGCLVQLTITVPEPATLNKITLVSDGNFLQKGTMNLTADNITLTSTSVSNTFDVDVKNLKTSTEDEDVVIYFMLPPTDLTSKSLKVKISSNLGSDLEYNLSTRNFEAGRIYALRASDIHTYHVETAGSLSSMISNEELYTIKKIKITGNLNGDDIRVIRDMGGSDYSGHSTDGILQYLDISESTIVEGGQYYYYDSSKRYTTNNVIGGEMFTECTSLISVKLPNNITRIEFSAFKKCTNLSTVSIPNTITEIPAAAFYHCENLKDIIIHNGVVKIWYDAFYGCHSLKSVRIPSSVTSIDYEAFDWCNGLTEFIVDDANQNYADIDGILYNKDISKMVICPYGYVTDNLVIPSTVTGFMGGFKEHRHITGKVTIPGSVERINGELFMNTYITEVLIEEGVTQIGYDAFCGTKLKKVTLPSTLSPWDGIQDGAFRANPSLSEIYYYGRPMQIYTNVFYNIASGCKLYVPKGAKESFVNSSSWNRFFEESDIIEMEN